MSTLVLIQKKHNYMAFHMAHFVSVTHPKPTSKLRVKIKKPKKALKISRNKC